ncbi:putative methionine aminopeptidase type 1 [Kalaharituber pfeilii]|nr:putative methionine aminopeptidase type 1 [Kalaharituber pfeilii]
MASTIAPVTKRACLGVACQNVEVNLKCPTCLKLGVESYFCSQDCFKKSWTEHKVLHKQPKTGLYDPFPDFKYTGSVRAMYPLSPMRKVPDHIPRPDYHNDGIPKSELKARGPKVEILNEKQIEGMRKVCRLAREVLDIAAAFVKPGVTTDQIDEVVHNACIERDSYPSPLNYRFFPKSCCTSVNETICHGIPDQRVLLDGDIINIDVTLYHEGFHGDINETYYVGEKAMQDPDSVRVVETARECLDKAIEIVKPGMPFREPGNVIEAHAKSRGTSVVKTYIGHGVHFLFHAAPNVPHYAKNKAVGVAKPGMCFTIEPMINLGTYKDKTWPDDWTSTTLDGKRSAQFEHTLLVTETGVEVLTARLPTSPGGPVSLIEIRSGEPAPKFEEKAETFFKSTM